jgi:hypothetical protein
MYNIVFYGFKKYLPQEMVIIASLVTAYEAAVFLSYLGPGEDTYLSKIKPPNQVQFEKVNHKDSFFLIWDLKLF